MCAAMMLSDAVCFLVVAVQTWLCRVDGQILPQRHSRSYQVANADGIVTGKMDNLHSLLDPLQESLSKVSVSGSHSPADQSYFVA